MGIFQITEGSFPIILNDLLRITVCTALGSVAAGALCGFVGTTTGVPSGGFLALPAINKPVEWLVILLVGSLIFAIALQFLKRKPSEIAPAQEDDSADTSLDDLSFSEF